MTYCCTGAGIFRLRTRDRSAIPHVPLKMTTIERDYAVFFKSRTLGW